MQELDKIHIRLVDHNGRFAETVPCWAWLMEEVQTGIASLTVPEPENASLPEVTEYSEQLEAAVQSLLLWTQNVIPQDPTGRDLPNPKFAGK